MNERPRCTVVPGSKEHKKNQKSWWDENKDAVEGKLIDLLMASDARGAYQGPERRSRPSLPLNPEDAALVREQAKRLGVSFEEHARRIFHEAVHSEQRRLGKDSRLKDGKLKPCKAVEPWPSMSAKSA
jgi:hypothetical protein